MFGWFRGKQLIDVLNETKKVKVHGIIFTIRKVNVLNYLDGSEIIQPHYGTYQVGKDSVPTPNEKKVKKYFSEVFVAGVVSPKISFKDEEGCINVENMFTDWGLVTDLHQEIMVHTYGKKKMALSALQKTS